MKSRKNERTKKVYISAMTHSKMAAVLYCFRVFSTPNPSKH